MDGEPPQEEDFSQIPIVERSQHKNWKARLSAYTDVIAKSAKTASDTDPFFRPYVSDGALLKKWCLDANAVAQEKGVEAVLAIVQYSGESGARTRADVTPSLVEKTLGSVRAGTKKKGTELCCMYVEVENSGEGVVTDVLAGLDAKQPKVVAGSISCLDEIIQSFGLTVIGNVKPILKVMPKIFGHTDKNVRAEGSALATTLYTYLGPALTPSLAELKPVQMSELQKAFDTLDAQGKGAGTGKPTRWTRKAQRDREGAEATGGEAEDEAGPAEEAAPIDPRSLLDPVNVLAKFPDNLDEQVSSTKWKERLEVLEECNKVLAQPGNARISDSSVDAYGSLVSTLGTKCKSDANVNVVIEAAKVVEGLANGLGKPFGRFRGVVMPGIIERLKERKANVVEALGRALDAVFSTTTLSDIVDDVLTGCKSKNPQVREGSLKFLLRSLQTTTDAPGKDQIKPMAESLVSLLSDSLEPVRTSAAECLGTMMKILGERTFNPFIENVPELQMAKVKDAFGRAEIKYKAGGAKAASTSKAPAAAPIKKAPIARPNGTAVSAPKPAPSSPPIKASGKFNAGDMLDEFAAPPVKAPPARFAKPAAKPVVAEPPKPAAVPAKKAAAPAGASKAGPSKALASSPSEPVKYRYSNDDALAQAADLIPPNFQTSLADGAWKVRLESAEEMVKWVEEEGADKVDSEIMTRFLAKTPGWGEKNFQVSAKIYQIIQVMAEKSSTFGKPSASLCIGHLTDKLGDMKLKKPAGDALTVIAEKTSLAFVLAQGYEPMSKQKAPKAQADALTWIKQQINDFGISGIPLRELISFVKTALGSPNALVRASATQLLVTVKIFVGGDISGFLEDLNPQLLSTINSEFDKASSQTPPEPTRTQADLQEVAAGPGKQGKAGADPLDDLVPRVDLDKLVNQTSVLADSRSDAWKVRKEAFEALSALLEVKSNQRLKPNMGEIGTVLKKAMADTNLSVKMLALGIITKIATGMGQPFDKYNKLLTPAVASVCADQKATTRSSAIATLNAMAEASGGLDSLYPGLASSCETTNPALRAAVLGWLAERFQADAPAPSSDLQPLAAPVVHCLEDRNADVRKAASAVLPFVVANTGADFVMDQTSGLKPASRSTIIPLIEKARANAPSSSTPSAPAKGTTAAAGPSKTAAAKSATPGRPVKAPVPARASPAPAARPTVPPVRSLAMKALSTAPSSRQPVSHEDRATGLPKPRTAARPASSQSSAPSATSSSARVPPYQSDAPEPRAMRVKKDSTRWILEASPKTDLTEYLAHQMEHHASPDLYAQLFSKDHRAEEDYMAALSALSDFYASSAATTFALRDDEVQALQMANIDLTVKYAALKLLSNNTQITNRCLELITNIADTVARYEQRFSDAEAKLFVPALIFKLGDTKFGPKLAPIFDSLDRIIAASQVVQLLVQYGLEDKSSGKTCKNESLQLIEKAYRKRGSILRSKDDRGFYEAVSRCISDSGTRNAALSVMALLQLLGSSKALEQVIETMPQGSKDMLANRRATMAASKAGSNAVKSEAPAAAGSPARRKTAHAQATPSARTAAAMGSPAAKVASPATRLPRPGGPSPALGRPPSASSSSNSTARGVASPSGSRPPSLPRPGVAAPSSRLQKGSDPFAPAPRSSMMPLGRANAKPANGHPFDPVSAAINDLHHEDPERTVDALKHIQVMLNDTPHFFDDSVQTLTDALLDELDRAFTPPEQVRRPEYFRLVKHLIQSFSGIACNHSLIRKLSFDDLYALLNGLSLRLVQADRLGGTCAELSKYINMIIIQSLSTPDRLLVFKVMFRLLYSLAKDFGINKTDPEEEVAAHADLILKCLWKRCKVLDEDLKSGRLNAGKLLRVIEDFLEGIGPQEWRRREQEGVALGGMPLRTIKTVLQRMATYAAAAELDIYEILTAEFGDSAADTIVYSYLFRLADIVEKHLGGTGSNSPPPAVELPTRSTSSGSAETRSPVQPSEAKSESEAERLVRGLTGGDQKEALDQLYSYIKANPDKENDVWIAVSSLSTAVQTYVRRMVESRKAADNPSPPRGVTSPLRSPTANRPSSLPGPPVPQTQLKRGPRPSSLAVDKTAPAEDQLAALKNVFARANLGSSQGGGEPLSEIDDPQNR